MCAPKIWLVVWGNFGFYSDWASVDPDIQLQEILPFPCCYHNHLFGGCEYVYFEELVYRRCRKFLIQTLNKSKGLTNVTCYHKSNHTISTSKAFLIKATTKPLIVYSPLVFIIHKRNRNRICEIVWLTTRWVRIVQTFFWAGY